MKWEVVVFGPEEELEKARHEILALDSTAIFDPEKGCYTVQEGDEEVVSSRKRLEVGTKHFVCRSTLHIFDLRIQAGVDFSWP